MMLISGRDRKAEVHMETDIVEVEEEDQLPEKGEKEEKMKNATKINDGSERRKDCHQ